MKIKPNIFSTQIARTKIIKRSNGVDYTVRYDKFRFLYPDEYMVFFDVLKDKQKITFNFLINTGARINEVRHVKLADVDFDRNNLIIRQTKSRNNDGTRKIRAIAISSQFAKWLRAKAKEYELKPEDTFPILSTPASNIAMQKALARIGIKDRDNLSVHSIRKTTEAWLMALEIDSLKVAKHMGHTLAVAERYYVSPDTFNYEDKQLMRQIIGDLYQK